MTVTDKIKEAVGLAGGEPRSQSALQFPAETAADNTLQRLPARK